MHAVLGSKFTNVTLLIHYVFSKVILDITDIIEGKYSDKNRTYLY